MRHDAITLLVMPRIQVQNANAISSAITIGFPAITGFMGAVHAMERKVRAKGFDVRFGGVGIIAHDAQLHTYQHAGSYQRALIGKAQVINKDGSGKSFIPDGRVHLTVSLVVECIGLDESEQTELLDYLSATALKTSRIAGGDILGFEPPYLVLSEDAVATQKAMNRLMPGYAIVDRSELMRGAMAQGQDAIDALLDLCATHHCCEPVSAAEDDNAPIHAKWMRMRREKGWLVPIGVGFHGLTPPGQAKHVRDHDVPHRFAESVVSIGEFKMLHKLSGPDEFLWRYDTTSFNDLYLCVSKAAMGHN